jgi:hypothetical protein
LRRSALSITLDHRPIALNRRHYIESSRFPRVDAAAHCLSHCELIDIMRLFFWDDLVSIEAATGALLAHV